MDLVSRTGDPIPADADRAPPSGSGSPWRPSSATSGCQSSWRAAVRSGGRGRDSVALERARPRTSSNDNRNLHGPLAHPQGQPALRTPTRSTRPRPWSSAPTAGGRCQAAQEPRGRRRVRRGPQLFQQGKLAEAEDAFAKIAKKRKGTPWGEKAQYYLAETPVPARKVRRRARQLREARRRLSRHRVPRQARQPRVRDRPDLARAERSQGQARAEAPLVRPLHRRAAPARHPGHRPQGPRARPPPRPDRPARRRRRAPDRRLPHEAAATTSRPRSTTTSSSTDHPKSPFLQKAQLAAIDARIKGYLGPEYDGTGLEKARELIKQTMATFPDRQAEQRKALPHPRPDQRPGGRADLQGRRLLQADRQGHLGRVLLRQDPPALAQQPLGREGQGPARRARQDAPQGDAAQQDHSPSPAPTTPSHGQRRHEWRQWAQRDGAVWAAWAAWGMGGPGGMM